MRNFIRNLIDPNRVHMGYHRFHHWINASDKEREAMGYKHVVLHSPWSIGSFSTPYPVSGKNLGADTTLELRNTEIQMDKCTLGALIIDNRPVTTRFRPKITNSSIKKIKVRQLGSLFVENCRDLTTITAEDVQGLQLVNNPDLEKLAIGKFESLQGAIIQNNPKLKPEETGLKIVNWDTDTLLVQGENCVLTGQGPYPHYDCLQFKNKDAIQTMEDRQAIEKDVQDSDTERLEEIEQEIAEREQWKVEIAAEREDFKNQIAKTNMRAERIKNYFGPTPQ